MQFKTELVGLEMDMITSASVFKPVTVGADALHVAAHTYSTDIGSMQPDTKALRSCCKNAVGVTISTLQFRMVWRRQLAIMVHGTQAMSHWQGHAAKVMTNSPNSRSWLLDQMAKGFHAVQKETLDALADQAVLKECGFFEYETVADEHFNDIEQHDQHFATMFGNLALILCGKRQVRTLHVTSGWPHRMTLATLHVERAGDLAKEFEQNLKDFRHLRDLPEPDPSLVELMRRTSFKTAPVQQYIYAFEEVGFRHHRDVVALACKRTNFVNTTVPVEVANNLEKNCAQARGSMKMHRPSRSQGVVLAKDLLGSRYKFAHVATTVAPPCKALQLSREVFGLQSSTCSLDVSGVASTTQKAPYFSPAAENMGLPAIDLALSREAVEFKRERALRFTFAGCFAKADHLCVFRRKAIPGKCSAIDWSVGLHHYNSSGFLAWPVVFELMPGSVDCWWVKLSREVTEPCLYAAFGWEGIEAIECEWRAWSWQVLQNPGIGAHWSPQIRIIAFGAVVVLEVVVARAGWFLIDGATLKLLAALFKWALSTPDDDLRVLIDMTVKALNCTPEEAMTFIAKRLAKVTSKEFKLAKTLLEIDEASKCLTAGDEEAMKEAQKKAKDTIRNHRAFKQRYKDKRRQMRVAKQPAAKAKGKGRGKGAPAVPKHPTPASFEMMAHAQVKPFAPPDTKLWKSRSGTWHSRVRTQGECSRAIATRGEDAAIRLVLGNAWRTYCLLEGLDEEKDIPWQGLLFDDEVLESSDDEA